MRSARLAAGLASLTLLYTSSIIVAGTVRLNDEPNKVTVKENTALGFKATLNFAEFNTMEVKNGHGVFTRIQAPGFARSGEFGHPEIPVKSELIEIPAGAVAEVIIHQAVYREYRLADLGIAYPIMPNQPPVPKTGEPAEFAYNAAAYQADGFLPATLAKVENLGVMRGVRIGRLDMNPLQYNPATGMVRVYERLEIEVVFIDADIAAYEHTKQIHANHYFSPLFGKMINYRPPSIGSRENLTQYPIKYVIVADRMFESQLQPFIEWKTRTGFTVVEAYTDEPNVGTTTNQIKAFLQNLYDNGTPEDPAPSFVLFVGDIAQVPTWTGIAAGHVTDLYYVEYTNDYFPEVFYGRFSAQNPAQLQPQIDKTLMYEQFTMPVPTYLDTVVMVAGMDGTFGATHGNGQINYGTINYFNDTNGIYSHTYLYPNSGSNAANIRQNISDGVTFANYTAHCSPSGWGDPSFTTAHIPALQNSGKYGLLVGNCCSSSEYQVNECFGEAIVRAANKGAVAYIGASNSTYWDEDYYFGVGVGTISGNPPSYEQTTLGFYDRAFHTHGEPFGEWYTAADQMIYAGNLAVTLGTPGSARYYWEAYNLLGDPSLKAYFSMPPAMTVTFDPLIPLGSPVFTVNAVPYAYAAISLGNVLYAAALADSNGVATLVVSGMTTPGWADVVVTAQNYQPFQGQVLVANPEGPYVVLNDYFLHDTTNNNGMAEPGEDVFLDMELKNWGSSDAQDVTATLTTEDTYVSLIVEEAAYGDIAAQDSVMHFNAFQFLVADSIPDQHLVAFNVLIEENTRESWNSSFTILLNAPVMMIGNLAIVDTTGGNGNYRLDPGETVDLVLDCHNTGHCDAYDVLASLHSNSPYITIHNDLVAIDTLSWNGMHQAVFTITLSEQIEAGTIIDLNVTQTSGYYSAQKTFQPKVGLVLEDFETGDFSAFGWAMGGNQPWQITGSYVYEGAFSARSGSLGNSQTSVLMIDLDVAVSDSISFYRKVSCEDDPGGTGYDWMAFYIDNTEMIRWDGELDWERFAYPVTAGQHTFKWVYSKDYSVAAGADAAWVDFIVFPALAPVISVPESPSTGTFHMNIFPNPVRDHAEIYVNLEKASEISVDVFDLAGKKVMTAVPTRSMGPGAHRFSLGTSDLNAGLYFCRLQCGGQQITKKLIIQ